MKIRAILVLLVLWMGSLAIAQEAEGFAVRGGVELSGEADVWISLYAIVDGVMQEEPLAQTAHTVLSRRKRNCALRRASMDFSRLGIHSRSETFRFSASRVKM